MIDHLADGNADRILAAQRLVGASDAALNVAQLALGGIEEFAAFARSLVGEQRICIS